MHLPHLTGLGLVQPSTATGTFKTLPLDGQRAIATVLVAHFTDDFDAAVKTTLRSADDVTSVLEAIGPAFAFPLPRDGQLVQDALAVYFRLLHPKRIGDLPSCFAAGPSRDRLMVTMLRHVSMLFQPSSAATAADPTHRQLVLRASNLISAFLYHSGPLVHSSDTWTAIVHVLMAIVNCHITAPAFAETRGATASVAFEGLLRSRLRTSEVWALVQKLIGGSAVAPNITAQWYQSLVAVARALAPALAGQPLPTTMRVDWVGLPAPLRDASTIPLKGLTAAELSQQLQAMLRVLGPIDALQSAAALLDATTGVHDVAMLFCAAPLWDRVADADHESPSQYRFALDKHGAVLPPLFPAAGPTTRSLAGLLGTSLLKVLSVLPASPVGTLSGDVHITALRTRVKALQALCAIYVRRESIGVEPSEHAAFFTAVALLLRDNSLVVRGHTLLALKELPAIALVTDGVLGAIVEAAAVVLSPNLREDSPESIVDGRTKQSPVREPEEDEEGEAAAAGVSDDDDDEFELLQAAVRTPLGLFRAAALQHLATLAALPEAAKLQHHIFATLFNAVENYAGDASLAVAAFSAAQLALQHLDGVALGDETTRAAVTLGGKAPADTNAIASSTLRAVGEVLNPASRPTILAAALHFVREAPITTLDDARHIISAISDLTGALRRSIDVAAITANLTARRPNAHSSGPNLDVPTATRIFALATQALERVCVSFVNRQVRAAERTTSDLSCLITEEEDVAAALLRVVDNGAKTLSQETHSLRDAAHSLLRVVVLLRLWPFGAGCTSTWSTTSEKDFAPEAVAVRCFAVSSDRIITVLQCVNAERKPYTAFVVRDGAGRWCWRIDRDVEAPRAAAPHSVATDAAVNGLGHYAPTARQDVLARTSLDEERHSAVIRRWSADPPLAAALKNMQAADAEAARAAVADNAEFPTDTLLAAVESGAHACDPRLLFADLGFISPRTRTLRTDARLFAALKAIDCASPTDVLDVTLVRIDRPDSTPDGDDQRFTEFCAALGVEDDAGSGSYINETPFATLRYHPKAWMADSDLPEDLVRIVWDGTAERYDHTASTDVLIEAHLKLNPQWAQRDRSAIEVVVSPLRAHGGLFLVRMLAPQYMRREEALAVGAPLTPAQSCIVTAASLPHIVESAVLGVLQDTHSCDPALASPHLARMEMISRIAEQAVEPSLAGPDPIGTQVLVSLLTP